MGSSSPGRICSLLYIEIVLLKILFLIEWFTTCNVFTRSQDEEARTARVIRKCSALFNSFIVGLEVSFDKANIQARSIFFPSERTNIEAGNMRLKMKLKSSNPLILGDDQLQKHRDLLE